MGCAGSQLSDLEQLQEAQENVANLSNNGELNKLEIPGVEKKVFDHGGNLPKG